MPSRQENRISAAGGIASLYMREASTDKGNESPNISETDTSIDCESLYQLYSSSISSDKTVIFQGSQRIPRVESLFYTDVTVEQGTMLKAMIDSGSMACTLSLSAEARLIECVPNLRAQLADDVVIVGCGGHEVSPKAMYELEVTVYGCRMIIPVLVVPGQTDDMILGSNAIKQLIKQMKETDGYWRLMSTPNNNQR